MKIKSIQIESNNTEKSIVAEKIVRNFARIHSFDIVREHADLIIAIGGDGSFIQSLHNTNFDKSSLYVGIHTGHLGFLQEVNVDEIEKMFQLINSNQFRTENISIENILISTTTKSYEYHAINEMVVRERDLKTLYLDVLVNQKCLESFSGDGLIVSTPTGSTAYNLSTGGSIIYPGLSTLQILPLSPLNSGIYRSLTNGVIVPENMTISLIPDDKYKERIMIFIDGSKKEFDNIVERIDVTTNNNGINVIRFDKYDFWSRIKEKFL